METIDLFSPELTQRGIFNANPEGELNEGEPTGPYGLPAPFPTFVAPDHRRADDEADDQGENEYHALRDLTWSDAEHLFYGADDNGLYRLTAGGQSTLVGNPFVGSGGLKGITFFTVEGERRLLVTQREGADLYTLNPES